MKRLVPLMIAAGMLFVLLAGLGPAPAQATGPSLTTAVVGVSGSVVTPMVVAKTCPPKYKWNSSKKCCWSAKKKKCRCKDGKVWNQGRFKCVKPK